MNANTDGDMFFIQGLFGLAILAFIALIVIEKRHPYRHFPQKIYKESFVTNTHGILGKQSHFVRFKGVFVIFCRATVRLFWLVERFVQRPGEMDSGVCFF